MGTYLRNSQLTSLGMGLTNFYGMDEVDISKDIKKGVTDYFADFELKPGLFNDILDKMGISSVADLAKKYNVDLNARGSADKFVEALKENTKAVTGMKDSMKDFKAEVYVDQHFNGPITKEDIELANQEVYKAIDRAFDARGVGA
jgi:hypothetical protein